MFITEKFEEICELVTDGTHDSPKLKSTGVPFIKGKHISKGTIDFENCDYISEEDHKKVKKRVEPQKDDILFSNIGSVGDTARINSDIEFSIKNVALFRANCEKIHADYLYYLVKSSQFREKALQLVSGSAQPFISLANLRRFKVEYLRDKEKQKRIASILSNFDNLIENNSRRIEILEEMARRIYREWFVHFRYPGHVEDELVDSGTELGAIPQGWEVKSFDEIAEVLSGGTPKTKVNEYWDGDLPFFSPKDATENFFVLKTSRTVSQKGVDHCASKLYHPKTIFITARGTVGKLNMPLVPMAMNQSCYALQAKDGLGQYFVFFSIENLVKSLQKKAHGAVFDTIIMDTFKQIYSIIPPLELTKKFERKVEPMLDQIQVLLKKNENFKTIRDLLLPKLISGEVEYV